MQADKSRVSGCCWGRMGEKQKAASMLLKPFICNVLTPVARQGFPLSTAGLSLGTNLQFLTSDDKHSQRVSFTNRQRKCPEEGDTSGLSLSGIKECKFTTSKFLLDHNGGLGRQEDEMRKEDGGGGGC